MFDGIIILTMCILSPKYITPEKATYCYRNNIPLVGRHVAMDKWIDDDMEREIINMVEITGNQRMASEYYGLDPATFSTVLRKARTKFNEI